MSPLAAVGVVSLVVGVATFILVNWRCAGQPDRYGTGATMGSVAAFLVFIFVSLVTVIKIPQQSAVIAYNGDVRAEFQKGVTLWKWDARLKEARVVSYKSTVSTVRMTLNPITENPKVRPIVYWVEIASGGTVADYLAHKGAVAPYGGTQQWLEYWLYEFDEQHSNELGSLYNPRDPNQQIRFSDLVIEFLEPKLHSARAKFINAWFALASQN